MPKKDGFADAKKEADKAKKKMVEVQRKEAKIAKEQAKEEEEEDVGVSTTAAPANYGKMLKPSNGTFAKAAAVGRDEEEEQEEAVAEDYDYDVAETSSAATASASSKGKKESKADAKKQAKMSKKDEFAMLAEHEREAKTQRIKDRFFKAIIVGVVMDMWKGDNGTNGHGKKKAPEAKETKKAKKSQNNDEESNFSVRSIKEKIDAFSGPIMLLVVLLAVLYGKAMEDTYSPNFDASVDFYDVMGVPHDASVMDIRKKYKSLALTWHPDKNPDCEACPEKFAAISKAYETLSDVEAKKAYDSKSAARETTSSQGSVDLTAEDFEAKVLRSNEVWYVLIYDDLHGGSSFHPIWEEIATKHGDVARFGRIDAHKHKRAMDFLPQRVVIFPMVFRFARGQNVEGWQWQGGSAESGGAPLARFIVDTYPVMHKMENADELTAWWKRSDRSRLLISGNAGVIRRGAQNNQFFKVLKEAHMWADNFAITSADAKDTEKALQGYDVELPGAHKKKGHPWSVIYIPAGETNAKIQITYTDDLKELPAKIEEMVQKAMSTEAPHLTVRNHRQLCGAGTASRTYCLVMVDMTANEKITQVLGDVAASRTEYAKELAEMREAESDTTTEEEPFRIQAVRVMTGTSRFPSQPVAVSRDFYTAWAEVGRAPMFLVELETQRVSAVKESVMNQLYQQIAYEDIKLKELPEDFVMVRAMPDPEMPLRRAIFRIISTPVGAILTYLLLAAATAVCPELPLVTNAAAGCGFFALVILVWPLACRRLLSIFVF